MLWLSTLKYKYHTGLFEDITLKTSFRMTTQKTRTSDEYGLLICNILDEKLTKRSERVTISSVVPKIMHSLSWQL